MSQQVYPRENNYQNRILSVSSRTKISFNFDSVFFLLLFFASHILLALLFRFVSPMFGVFHALLLVGFGVYAATRKHFNSTHCIYIVAYIVGAEVLWRMTDIPIFWETAKYAIILILGLAHFRSKSLRIPFYAFFYLLFLLPGVTILVIDRSSEASQFLSNYFSGPLALFVTMVFFTGVKITILQVRNLFLLLAGPVAGIVALATHRLLTYDIVWTNDSNNIASGGFGANQVSSTIGLAWLLMLITIILFKTQRNNIILLPIAVWFIIQNFFTFSRGGLYTAFAGVVVLLIHNFFKAGQRRSTAIIVIAGLFIAIMIFNQANEVTGGRLQDRFSDTQLTNRELVIGNELELFMQNPIVGTGLGLSRISRLEIYNQDVSTHTEYTRLLVEHGILGILTLFILFGVALYNYTRQKSLDSKGIIAALIVWSLLYMTHAAMRTAAPSFILGLICVQILEESHQLEVSSSISPF